MFSIFSAQKMVTVMPDSDDQQIDRNRIDKSDESDIRFEDDIKYVTNNGYDYNNLYGLLAVPFLGIVFSIFTYLLKRYQCHGIVRIINFFLNNNDGHGDENDSYGSQSTATPPIILYPRDFSGYNTSQTSSYATTQFSDKEIQTSLPSIDLEDRKFDSSDGSRGSSLAEEDVIYINIKEPNLGDSDPSLTRSGTKYKK